MKIGGVEVTTDRVIVALAVLINIQGAIGHGGVSLTHMVPAEYTDGIIAWNNFLAYVGATIMGAVAAPRAFSAIPAPNLPTVVKVLMVAFLPLGFLAMASGPVQAQVKLRAPQITGDFIGDAKANLGIAPGAGGAVSGADQIMTALAKPFTDIANFIGGDADGAVTLSTAVPAIQDGHGQQCWMAMQSFGAIIKAHPVPLTFHVINDYETLRLLGIATNQLCSNVHCTQVFADATAMAQAASPVPLVIPSLHDLCTKVPQIAVVAPIAVSTAPAPAATPTTPAPAAPLEPASK
jgi:hypothetical protein